MSPRASWLLFNIPVYVALVVGFALGIEGLKNIAVFVIWFYCIVSIITLVPTMFDYVVVEMMKEGRSRIPRVVKNVVYIGAIVFLVWHGAFFTACALLFSFLVAQVVFQAVKNRKALAPGLSIGNT